MLIFIHKRDTNVLKLYAKTIKTLFDFSNDSQRKQFSELFALMEEEEEISTTKSRLQGRGRKPVATSKPSVTNTVTAKRQIARDLTDSSEDTSEVSIFGFKSLTVKKC